MLISLTAKVENTKKATKVARHTKRPQMKEKVNSPEKLDEMEASNLSDREFRIIIIRILNSMKKDIETIKKDLSEIKNVILEKNNMLEGVNLSLIHI